MIPVTESSVSLLIVRVLPIGFSSPKYFFAVLSVIIAVVAAVVTAKAVIAYRVAPRKKALVDSVLSMFEEDAHTEKVVLIGEIGGTDEERAAEFISEQMTKPVVAFVAGRSAPPGKRMGHAGAIVEGGTGLASDKIRVLEGAGVRVAEHPEQIPELLQ